MAFLVMDYMLVSVGKVLLNLTYDALLYGKAGVGVALINNLKLDEATANIPTPIAAVSLGIRTQLTNHFDIDASVGLFANYAKRTTISTGSRVIYQLVKSQFSLGVRYKI